jgi:hypothetical protein
VLLRLRRRRAGRVGAGGQQIHVIEQALEFALQASGEAHQPRTWRAASAPSGYMKLRQ